MEKDLKNYKKKDLKSDKPKRKYTKKIKEINNDTNVSTLLLKKEI